MTKAAFGALCVAMACSASTASPQSAPPAAPAVSSQVTSAKPAPARASTARPQPGRPGSLEVSGSAAWLAPGSLGTSTATLTANSSSTPYVYFDTSGRMGGALGLDARVTYNLTRRVALEGGLLYSRPAVQFTVSHDAEGATGFTSSGENLSQYFLDGNVLLFLPGLAFSQGRGRIFVQGGAGYLRQLHDGRFNVDTGTVYNGGAGLKYYFAPRAKGLMKGFGVRADLRGYYRRGGFSFDGANTWSAGLGAGVIVAF
jgi:hypothetical protein